MPKKNNPDDENKIRDRLESFNADLVNLFNKHHMCVLFKFEHVNTIEEGYFVESLAQGDWNGERMIVPMLTVIDWDKILKLDGD